MFKKSKEEVLNLFDIYGNKVKKEETKSINWLNDLKNNVLDIFNKMQKKSSMGVDWLKTRGIV